MIDLAKLTEELEIEYAKEAAKSQGISYEKWTEQHYYNGRKPIVSRQIRALAKVLVNAINDEFASLPSPSAVPDVKAEPSAIPPEIQQDI